MRSARRANRLTEEERKASLGLPVGMKKIGEGREGSSTPSRAPFTPVNKSKTLDSATPVNKGVTPVRTGNPRPQAKCLNIPTTTSGPLTSKTVQGMNRHYTDSVAKTLHLDSATSENQCPNASGSCSEGPGGSFIEGMSVDLSLLAAEDSFSHASTISQQPSFLTLGAASLAASVNNSMFSYRPSSTTSRGSTGSAISRTSLDTADEMLALQRQVEALQRQLETLRFEKQARDSSRIKSPSRAANTSEDCESPQVGFADQAEKHLYRLREKDEELESNHAQLKGSIALSRCTSATEDEQANFFDSLLPKDQAQGAHKRDWEALRTYVRELQGELKAVKDELEEERGECERFQRELSVLDAENKDAQQRISSMTEIQAELKAALSAATKERDSLAAQVLLMRTSLETSEREREASSNSYEELKKISGEKAQEHSASISDLSYQLQALQHKYQGTVDAAAAAKDSLAQAIKNLQCDLAASQQEEVTLSEQLKRLGSEIKTIHEELKDVQKQRDEAEAECERRNQRVGDLEDTIESLQGEIMKKEETLTEVLSSKEAEIQAVKGKCAEQEKHAIDLKLRVEETERELACVRVELESALQAGDQKHVRLGQLEDELEALQRDLMGKTSGIEVAERNVNDLREKLTQIEKQEGELRVTVRDKEIRIAELESEVAALDKLLMTNGEAAEEMLQGIKLGQEELQSLSRQVAEKTQLIEALTADVAAMGKSLEAVQAQLRDRDEDVVKMSSQVENLNTQLGDRGLEAEAARNEIDQLIESSKDKDAEVESLSKNVEWLQNAVAEKEAEAVGLRKDLTRKTQELQELVGEKEEILAAKKQAVSDLSNDVACKVNQMQDLAAEKEMLEAKLKDKGANLNTLWSQLTAQELDIENLNCIMKDKEVEIGVLRSQLHEKDRENATMRESRDVLSRKVETLKRTVVEIQSTLDQAFATVGEQECMKHQVEREIEKLRKVVEEQEASIDNLQGAREGLENDCEQLRKTVSEKESDIESLRVARDQLVHEHECLRKLFAEKEQVICSVQGARDQLENDCQQLQGSLLEQTGMLEHLQGEKDHLTVKCEVLEQALAGKNGIIQGLEAALEKQSKVCEELKEASVDQDKLVKEGQAQSVQLMQESGLLKETIAEKEGVIASVQCRSQQLEDECKLLKQTMTEKYASMLERLQDAREKLESAHEETIRECEKKDRDAAGMAAKLSENEKEIARLAASLTETNESLKMNQGDVVRLTRSCQEGAEAQEFQRARARDLEGQIEDLRKNLLGRMEQIDTLTRDYETEKRLCEDLNGGLREAQGEMAGLRSQIAEMGNSIRGLSAAMCGKESEVSRLDKELAGLKGVLLERDMDVAGLHSLVCDREKEIAALGREIEVLRDELHQSRDKCMQVDCALKASEMDLLGAAEDCNGLRTELASVRSELEDRQRDVSGLRANVDALEGSVSAKEERIVDFEESVADFRALVKVKDDCIEDLRVHVLALESSVKDKESCIEDLKGTISGLKKVLKERQECVECLQSKVDVSESCVVEKDECIEGLLLSVDDLEGTRDGLMTRLSDLEGVRHDLATRVNILEEVCRESQAQAAALREQLAAESSAGKRAAGVVQDREKQLAALKYELDRAARELESISGVLAERDGLMSALQALADQREQDLSQLQEENTCLKNDVSLLSNSIMDERDTNIGLKFDLDSAVEEAHGAKQELECVVCLSQCLEREVAGLRSVCKMFETENATLHEEMCRVKCAKEMLEVSLGRERESMKQAHVQLIEWSQKVVDMGENLISAQSLFAEHKTRLTGRIEEVQDEVHELCRVLEEERARCEREGAVMANERDEAMERVFALEKEVLEERHARQGDAEKVAKERDAILGEMDAYVAQQKTLAAESFVRVAEKDAVTAKNLELSAKNLELITERDAVTAERDAITAERDAATAARDAVTAKNNELIAERDTLIVKNLELIAEMDVVTAERDAVSAKNLELFTERDAVTAQNHKLIAERDVAIITSEELMRSRRDLLSDMDESSEKQKISEDLLRAELFRLAGLVKDREDDLEVMKGNVRDAHALQATLSAREEEARQTLRAALADLKHAQSEARMLEEHAEELQMALRGARSSSDVTDKEGAEMRDALQSVYKQAELLDDQYLGVLAAAKDLALKSMSNFEIVETLHEAVQQGQRKLVREVARLEREIRKVCRHWQQDREELCCFRRMAVIKLTAQRKSVSERHCKYVHAWEEKVIQVPSFGRDIMTGDDGSQDGSSPTVHIYKVQLSAVAEHEALFNSQSSATTLAQTAPEPCTFGRDLFCEPLEMDELVRM